MQDQLSLVDVPSGGDMPLKFTDLSPREQRAINNFCKKGFVIQLSRLPNIEFVHKDTREIETHRVAELVAMYDEDRKEEARMRRAQKRLEMNQKKVTGATK